MKRFNLMVDIYNEQKRSEIMSSIKSRNTKLELMVKRLLCALGYRQYRILAAELECKPDIVFVKDKKTFFINGCFFSLRIVIASLISC